MSISDRPGLTAVGLRSRCAARVVKLNLREVGDVAALLELGISDPIDVARHFQTQFGVELVCVTRSADGCMLIDRDGVAEADGVHVEGVDPVGAGDAFTAGLIYGHLQLVIEGAGDFCEPDRRSGRGPGRRDAGAGGGICRRNGPFSLSILECGDLPPLSFLSRLPADNVFRDATRLRDPKR